MNIRERAKKLKQDIGTLYYSYHDERTPIFAKIFSLIVVSYALSPIDLIPDFIPVLGYLDDIILLPIGIYISLKLIPDTVIVDSRERAEKEFMKDRKSNYIVAGVIVIIWLIILFHIIRAVI